MALGRVERGREGRPSKARGASAFQPLGALVQTMLYQCAVLREAREAQERGDFESARRILALPLFHRCES